MTKHKIPRGTYDILPTESYKWQYVQNIFREVAKLYNFKEIVTPIFETSALFERSVGDTSDIVEKEMYKFSDKKGRILALRPEGTASVVRSLVENNLDLQPNSSKVYYMGPMFRYDRPQKGRYRQFYQYGIEYFGSENPLVDAQTIAFADTFLKKVGLKNYNLEINSIGNSNCSDDYDQALVNYFKPHLNELCNDCQRRIEKNPKRLLDCKNKTCKSFAVKAPSMLEYLDEECKIHFEKVQEYLTKMNIDFIINPLIVRGIDYYSQTAFEFIDTNLGAQNTLIGGGRYDGLVKQMGGRDVPGIGFAGGFERLLLSMEAESISFGEEQKPNIFLVTLGENADEFAPSLLAKFRANGIASEFDPDKHSIKAQMKSANRINADYVLILGDDELANDKINLKNMETGEQAEIALSEIIAKLKEKF
ncbi:MAG: histidine--tRNA ligase [Candidatus Cloacimonetes bacterium]|nr:histidine--tRNA ligase [Candidatus Cloacimonadota bacterium]